MDQPAVSDSVSPAEYNAWRVAKLEKRQQESGITTYPHKFHTTCSVKQFLEKYEGLQNGASIDSVSWNIAGRVMSKRESGQKLLFLDLVGEGD